MSTRSVIGCVMKSRKGDSMTIALQGVSGHRVIDVRKFTEDGGMTPYGLTLTASLWRDLIPLIQQGISNIDAE
jgi:hypothetical protein